MNEKELKLVLTGVTVVTTMLKLIIQHRGQVIWESINKREA